MMTCRHRDASLVYEPVHEFTAYQCDACGLILRRPVPYSALATAATDLPYLDDHLYTKTLERLVRNLSNRPEHVTTRRIAAMARR